ncbi:helix-turn-helix transcriptional regulator [Gordonia sp. UBA6683]|uniref:helix-turn-helix transcriptional regulator n=1 Tax=Gordonia sp. UBA6683 TaxID=1946577 RepID=UPI0025C6F654|nr:helix-turn-helix domain-containing protein [Gordonia sp. UBA6683]
MQNTVKDFGNLVAAQRAKLELRQADVIDRLAERGIKLDSSAITRIEKGQREPRLTEALALSEILEFPLGDPASASDDRKRLWQKANQTRAELEAAISERKEMDVRIDRLMSRYLHLLVRISSSYGAAS